MGDQVSSFAGFFGFAPGLAPGPPKRTQTCSTSPTYPQRKSRWSPYGRLPHGQLAPVSAPLSLLPAVSRAITRHGRPASARLGDPPVSIRSPWSGPNFDPAPSLPVESTSNPARFLGEVARGMSRTRPKPVPNPSSACLRVQLVVLRRNATGDRSTPPSRSTAIPIPKLPAKGPRNVHPSAHTSRPSRRLPCPDPEGSYPDLEPLDRMSGQTPSTTTAAVTLPSLAPTTVTLPSGLHTVTRTRRRLNRTTTRRRLAFPLHPKGLPCRPCVETATQPQPQT